MISGGENCKLFDLGNAFGDIGGIASGADQLAELHRGWNQIAMDTPEVSKFGGWRGVTK